MRGQQSETKLSLVEIDKNVNVLIERMAGKISVMFGKVNIFR